MKKKYALLIIFLLSIMAAELFAQFTITNPLTTSNSTGLKIGGNAYLTAATGVDPNGSGWLRLTDAQVKQEGYMYVKQDFPSTLGVIADFEYKAWRDVSENFFGADGFCVFLFNAAISEADFKLGGFGGSLGYATYSKPPDTKGLSGGYLGVGFDAYGNYARANENRNGGTSQFVPNAIVVRGPTSPTYTDSNVFLTSAELGDRTGTFQEIRQRNEIDYNTIVTTRPSNDVFYRRVQVIITKPSTDYLITVKWKKENQNDFTTVLTYTLSSSLYPAPSNLKLGFAASTAAGFNYHEIRNIILTTPGNLRVDTRSESNSLCNDRNSVISFEVGVTNDTDAALSDISLNAKFTDENNNLLDLSKFKITNVSLSSHFTNSTVPTTGFTSNNISGQVGLPAKTTGTITVTGQYFKKTIKNGKTIKLVSEVESNQVTDVDPTNNKATTSIKIKKCNLITNPVLPAYSK